MKDKKDKGVYLLFNYYYIIKVIIRSYYIEDGILEIGKYNKFFDEVVFIYGFEDVLVVIDYIVSYLKRIEIFIEDKFSFMCKFLMNNFEMF